MIFSSNQSLPIITITLNPAIDLHGNLANLVVNQVNRVHTGKATAAGKGVNVAAVIAALGGDVTASGWLGEENESAFSMYFKNERISDEFIRVAGETRTNIKLVEANQEVTELNFPGFCVQPGHIKQLFTQITNITEPSIVVLAGSLPAAVDPCIYRELIALLQKNDHKVCFDSSGQAFSQGVNSAPYMIKPNIHELSEWAGRPLKTFADKKSVAQQLLTLGVKHILLSEGEQGLLCFSENAVLQIVPPKMTVASTVGAGDSLLAAFVWALANQQAQVEALKFAVAVSALSVTQVGVADIKLEALQAICSQVVVKKVE